MSSGNKVVIGLDFGTTYSAVAYSDQVDGGCNINAIQAIVDWPGPRSTNEKVPSRISYGPPPAVEIKWGYQIKPNDKAKPHVLMKLKLDERLKRSKQMSLLLKFLAGLESLSIDDLDSDDEDEPPEYPGKSPVEVVADYLSEVRKHAWAKLEVKYGAELFRTLTKELVITVPAVWSERAKDLTLKAVTKAQWDVSKIAIVTEPEAAAVYTLKYMSSGVQQDQVKVNDHFVLVDAGGGTVDLISYKVTRIAPTYGVEEAVVGSGDKCGATFVEKEFLNWLKNWIGDEAYKKIPPAKLRHGNRLMDDFETYKMGFSGAEEDFQLMLPRECGIEEDDEKNIEDFTLSFTSDQMKQFFEPCINRTLELIDGQVLDLMRSNHSKPKMILVVGGFGRNAYLFNRITEYATERGIETRTPDAPWSAVVRGAVCRGLEGPQSGLVEVRLARKHYGTALSQPFIPGLHDLQDRYIDEYDGHPYARGQMRWLVDKSERLPEKNPKVAWIQCSASFYLNEDRHFGAVLSGCEADDAPQRFAHDDVHNICRVKADLSSVPLHKFTKNRVGLEAKEYYSCSFKLQATFVSGNIEWSFIFDGKTYAAVTVSYDS